jgi:flagellar capping protein FliD
LLCRVFVAFVTIVRAENSGVGRRERRTGEDDRMSMMCRMLQIDADLLAQLQEDPSSVADLFDGESSATRQFKLSTGPAVDEIKRRMLPQLQKVMQASFASLDERQREAL